MEGRIQQCSIDLTHKADKELVDELIKQRELAEADKPASVATDESFNEHDLVCHCYATCIVDGFAAAFCYLYS